MKKITGLVMFDVVGQTLNEANVRRIRHPQTAGIILFARHFANRQQLRQLTDAIRAEKSDILIAVDQEGGRVQRFREDGFTRLPAMRELGALWQKDAAFAQQAAIATGYILAAELCASGVDFSFTPVLDLDFGHSAVIGDRAFHRQAEVVGQLAKNLCYGMALVGMSSCGKHFPGHGYTRLDSHIALPVDERSLDVLRHEDIAPFAQLSLALTAILPAHVIYPQVDALPAGFSSVWLQDVLRQQLGYQGAIISDDLLMDAARQYGDVLSTAEIAVNAGCDLVLVCNQPEQAEQVLNGLSVQASAATVQRLTALCLKNHFYTWDEMLAQPKYQQAQALFRQAFAHD